MASTRARTLRKHPTDAERKLWSKLRRKQIGGYRFRRQHPIGPFVVDFVCLAEKLIIELDGGQHAFRRKTDDRRTAWLEDRGYRVIRFWNNDVLRNIEGVYELVTLALQEKDSPAKP